MAHWPRTIGGNVIIFALAIVAGAILVQLAMALSGPVVWAIVAFAVIVPLALYLWNEKTQRANDVAVAGAPSFGPAVARRRSTRN